MSQIEPRTLKGFRDFLPPEQISRQNLISLIKESYESFGFEPLETPALEYADILTGKYGDEGDKLMYRFKDNGDRDVAMRYDLTIPLARVVGQYNNDIKKPWKRYQIAPVWRAENTQKGRFREFYQCDADIVGTTSELADAEILALAGSTLQKLGIKDFVIRVNSREIITAYYESLGIQGEDQIKAMRAVDKIDKIGKDGVAQELSEAGFDAKMVESISGFAAVRINDIEDIGSVTSEYPAVSSALQKLVRIIQYALTLAPEMAVSVDFSIARGLDYYTGMIFETNLTAAPQFGSVLSGGRYDGLIGMFSKSPVPAVGASIGLDRLMAALEELQIINPDAAIADTMIVNFGEAFSLEYLRMASELREAGIKTMVYFDPVDIKKQLAYASEKGIKRAILFGENEAVSQTVVIKDLEKVTQDSVPRAELTRSFTI